MRLVIFANTPPPPKKAWSDPDQIARGEWSEIYEAVTTWFCYSNGLRKEHNLDIIIGEHTISIYGDRVRYLAPPLRSAASLLWHGYNGRQVGIEKVPSIDPLDYELPSYVFSDDVDPHKIEKLDLGTIFLNPSHSVREKLLEDGATKIPSFGPLNSQKLVWVLYQ